MNIEKCLQQMAACMLVVIVAVCQSLKGFPPLSDASQTTISVAFRINAWKEGLGDCLYCFRS